MTSPPLDLEKWEREKPYWWPVLADAKWCEILRKHYPDKADWTDEELQEHFNEHDMKYCDVWDHLGDAREDWEQLADNFLALTAWARDAVRLLESSRWEHHYCEDSWYSCPKAEDGCANEAQGEDCNCGADQRNAQFDALLARIKT